MSADAPGIPGAATAVSMQRLSHNPHRAGCRLGSQALRKPSLTTPKSNRFAFAASGQ